MSSPDDEESASGAARGFLGLILGLVLDQLALGAVLLGLILTAYAAIEAQGPAQPVALVVGVVAVVVPFVSWQRRWSDRFSWLVLGPLVIAVLAAFAWAGA